MGISPIALHCVNCTLEKPHKKRPNKKAGCAFGISSNTQYKSKQQQASSVMITHYVIRNVIKVDNERGGID